MKTYMHLSTHLEHNSPNYLLSEVSFLQELKKIIRHSPCKFCDFRGRKRDLYAESSCNSRTVGSFTKCYIGKVLAKIHRIISYFIKISSTLYTQKPVSDYSTQLTFHKLYLTQSNNGTHK
jgi:hypothetical protein